MNYVAGICFFMVGVRYLLLFTNAELLSSKNNVFGITCTCRTDLMWWRLFCCAHGHWHWLSSLWGMRKTLSCFWIFEEIPPPPISGESLFVAILLVLLTPLSLYYLAGLTPLSLYYLAGITLPFCSIVWSYPTLSVLPSRSNPTLSVLPSGSNPSLLLHSLV